MVRALFYFFSPPAPALQILLEERAGIQEEVAPGTRAGLASVSLGPGCAMGMKSVTTALTRWGVLKITAENTSVTRGSVCTRSLYATVRTTVRMGAMNWDVRRRSNPNPYLTGFIDDCGDRVDF